MVQLHFQVLLLFSQLFCKHWLCFCFSLTYLTSSAWTNSWTKLSSLHLLYKKYRDKVTNRKQEIQIWRPAQPNFPVLQVFKSFTDLLLNSYVTQCIFVSLLYFINHSVIRHASACGKVSCLKVTCDWIWHKSIHCAPSKLVRKVYGCVCLHVQYYCMFEQSATTFVLWKDIVQQLSLILLLMRMCNRVNLTEAEKTFH